MSRRSYPSSPAQTIIDFDATAPAPAEASDQDKIAEPTPADYSTAPAWIDTVGRTRT